MSNPCPPVVAIDSSQDNNGYLDAARKANPGALAVDNLKDLVDKLLDTASKRDCCLKSIKIIGHGHEGLIVVGNGRDGSDATKRINSAQSEWESQLERLKPALCEGAGIQLWACRVGAGDAGAAKLDAIAKVTGAKIAAPTGEVGGNGIAQKGSEMQLADPTPGKKTKPKAAPPPPSAAKPQGGTVPQKLGSVVRRSPEALVVLSGMVPVTGLTNLPRYLILRDRRVILALLSQIQLKRAYDVREIGAVIDARVIATDATLVHPAASLVVLNDFTMIGIEGRWGQFYKVSAVGREWIRQLAAAHLDWADPGHRW